MLAIGLMSGTSLDGVDAALVNIENERFELVKFVTLPYDESFKTRLSRNLNIETAKLNEISSLNFELGYQFVKAIDLLLQDSAYEYNDISFVASHGQTIWHDPKGTKCSSHVPSTLQIGEASIISYQTGIPTISNFRVMDVAAGGEGAPLVPFSEYVLFHSNTKNIVLQNIGGIGNLTYLKKNGTMKDVLSFDTGVGNVMIDYFVKKYFSKPYDKDGRIALQGNIIDEIILELMKDEFLQRKPPKSTGREQYSYVFMEELSQKLHFDAYDKKDIVTTITEFTARSIAYHYEHFLKDIDLVVVNGGGSHNRYLMKRLKEITHLEILTGEEFGINSDAKEAMAFAIMGYETINHRPSNVPSATGAKQDVILGNITLSPTKRK